MTNLFGLEEILIQILSQSKTKRVTITVLTGTTGHLRCYVGAPGRSSIACKLGPNCDRPFIPVVRFALAREATRSTATNARDLGVASPAWRTHAR